MLYIAKLRDPNHGFARIHFQHSRLFFLLAIVTLLSLFTPAIANGASPYYLDAVNGDDIYPGTSEQPWKTLSKAQSVVVGGDIVLLRSGNYGNYIEESASRSDWITYQAADGQSPEFASIKLGSTGGPYAMYLKFDGITVDANTGGFGGIKDNAIYCVNTNYTSFQNLTIAGRYTGTDTVHWYHGIYASNAWNMTVNNCTIYDSQMGVWTKDCNDLQITNCEIYDSRIGVQMHGIVANVSGNHLHDLYSDGILAHSLYVDILDNHIHDIERPDGKPYHLDGIQFYKPGWGGSYYYPSDVNIGRNRIYNIGVDGNTPNTYSQGMLIVGAEAGIMRNVNVFNNVVYNVGHTNPDSAGVIAVLVAWAETDTFVNNTIDGFLDFRVGSDIGIFANNIAYRCDIHYTDSGVTAPDYHNYNLINSFWLHYNPSFVFGSKDVDLTSAAYSALFAGEDMTLAGGSQAIGYANPTYAPATDILGVSRSLSLPPDAGCYEYTGSGSNNAAPILDSIGNKTVNENTSLAFDVNATDPNGDPITYSAASLPSGAALSGSSFSWTPSYSQSGTYQVTFIVRDSNLAQDSEQITITVNNVNRDPVLASISDTSVNEIESLNLALSATDADGDTITYSSPDLPSGAVLSGSSFTWTPGYAQAGSYTVTFTASDGTAQDSEQVSITVNNVNRTVVLDEIGGKSTYADDSLDFTVSATDPDGDTIIYSASNMPTGATFTNRVFSWTPENNQAGSYSVLFSASDSLLSDSETVTIVVTADNSAPVVTTCSPEADAVQVVLNSMVSLHIIDSGKGVNPASVTIKLNGNTIYTGDTAKYTSAYGNCYRAGTGSDYQYNYQQTTMFDFDQTMSITVDAEDLLGNQMSQHAYSFTTEMRSFGNNGLLSSAGPAQTQGYSASVADNSGNIWAVWHRGTTGARNIYVGKLAEGTEQFESPVQLTNASADQCNAAIAVDADDKLYVVWQDNRDGNWDIYSSTSTDGINFSTQRRVCDPNANQINPVIALDSSSPANAYVAWQDDVSGNQDISLAVSNNAFTTKTITQITSDSSDQTQPNITADAGNTVYVAWTDTRNSTSDIYAADSDNGPWTNVAVVTKSGDQTSPKIAAEQTGSILHLLWTDNISANQDIYYASSDGLPLSALTGTVITDDSSGANQSQPAIAVLGSTGNGLKVYACWKDLRNFQTSGDSDIYFVRADSGSGTNVFIDDDSTGSNQSNPVIAINSSNQPYIVWTDDRSSSTDIYYAGATYLDPTPINSSIITTASGGTVGPTLDNIDSTDDISVTVPAGAYSSDITVSILNITNPPDLSSNSLSAGYEIGPSGTDFSIPVTVVIPYASTGTGTPLAYWLNPETGILSQDGISNVQKLTLSSGLSAVSFQTTHFSQFFVGEGGIGGVSGGGGGGGGGGCSVSHNMGQARILDFILPYAVLAVVMTLLKKRDIRRQKARNI
ncbi:MAG: putative Ig domain-containing protein [Planctomycetota bacterium]|jgi:parallel beta-helix repeat protein